MLRSGVMRVRLAGLCFGSAGLLFILYPAIRPFSDETSLKAAAAFASDAWLIAHVLAMLGFILVTLGILGLHRLLRDTVAEGVAALAVVVTFVGTGLTLPFYGAEAFGLQAIGREALRLHSATLVSLAADVRSGPQLLIFLLGLLLLAVGAALVAAAVWRSQLLSFYSGILFFLGFALYIPQFFVTQPIRMAHGVLVAAGCLQLAISMWRQSGHLAEAGDDPTGRNRAAIS